MAKSTCAAAALERLADEFVALVLDLRAPARSTAEADRRIAEGERIAAAIRRAFRG